MKKRKSKVRKRARKTFWLSPTWAYKDPGEFAWHLARRSRSFRQAFARLQAFYDRYGFCNRASNRYNKELCAKRKLVLDHLREIMGMQSLEERLKDQSPGSQRFLRYLADAFRSPLTLAWAIYDMEDPEDFEGTERLPVLRTRFNTAFNSIAKVVGICDPNSPYYRPQICEDLPKLRRRVWRIYYQIIITDWAKGGKHLIQNPEEAE